MRFALVPILLTAVAASIQAQAVAPSLPDSSTQGAPKQYRDPRTALLLGSIIPGGGYAYAGEYFRGYFTYLRVIVGGGTGWVVYGMDGCSLAFLRPDCDPGPRWPYQLVGILGIGTGIYTWISSARDSRHAAERANARHAANSRKIHPILEPATNNGWNAGLSVNW